MNVSYSVLLLGNPKVFVLFVRLSVFKFEILLDLNVDHTLLLSEMVVVILSAIK